MSSDTARHRYDGLDAFRGLSIYGVVFIHFSQVLRLASTPALEFLIRLRDCAFPIIVLTSFFVLTRSLMAKPGRGFERFAAGRFRRLAVPCLIWTALYWLMWGVAGPIWHGGQASWPPWTVWLTGFDHLWFLQFVFAGTVLAYPVIRLVVRDRRPTWALAAACIMAAAGASLGTRWLVSGQSIPGWAAQADLSLRVFITKSLTWVKYIPLGIAMALVGDTIARLYRRAAFRTITWVLLAVTLAVHVTSLAPAVSRLPYSLAVFLVLLRPWRPGVAALLAPSSRYSYPIYIIHPAVAQGVAAALALLPLTPSIPALLAGSVAAFAASGAASALLRAAVPADWFLPLVAVGRRDAARGMG